MRSTDFFRVSVRHFSGTLKGLATIIAGLSFLGFLDATYLTVKHFQNVAPPCTILSGCETVTTSSYAEIFGVPVALLGAIYYLSVFLLTIVYFDTTKEKILRTAAYLTFVGLFATGWFLFAQAVLLDAWCLYCLGSAVTSTLLFLTGLGILAFDPGEEV